MIRGLGNVIYEEVLEEWELFSSEQRCQMYGQMGQVLRGGVY